MATSKPTGRNQAVLVPAKQALVDALSEQIESWEARLGLLNLEIEAMQTQANNALANLKTARATLEEITSLLKS